jgi:hypothetical protein
VDLVACTGTPCAGPDGDKNVRGRVSLTPDRTGSLTLIADLSAGLGLGLFSRHGTTRGPSFAIQSAPGFEAVDRGDGPDQLFEMSRRINPRNAISSGVILGGYISDRWVLGIGPALAVGGASGAFSQWNVRFSRRIRDTSYYLTFGPSLRFFAEPVDFELHDRISVPKPASGVAMPPQFRTSYGAELQLDIGLGIDIGTLSAAAGDTLKSLGGGK